MKKQAKQLMKFLENLHFHGYIDHDITKLDNLIEEYYPPLSEQESTEEQTETNANVIGAFLEHCKQEGFEIPDKVFESYFGA